MTKVTVYNNFVVALNFTCESVSLRGVSEMAENIRFRTKGYRLTWEELRDGVPLPFIVHWKQRHIFVGYDIIKNPSPPPLEEASNVYFRPGSGIAAIVFQRRIAELLDKYLK